MKVDFNGVIPKNPWVAVAVLGGVALLIYVIFEEFNSTVKTVEGSVTSLPGDLIKSTVTGVENAVSGTLEDAGTAVFDFGKGIINSVENLVTPAPPIPGA